MKRIIFLFALIVFSYLFVNAQQISKETTMWFKYKAGLNLPKDVGLNFEIEDRIQVSPLAKHYYDALFISANKKFKSNWTLGGGMNFLFYDYYNKIENTRINAPEFRPTIEVGYKQNINSFFSIQHRYRTEWRFRKRTNSLFTALENGYRNYFRFRYLFGLEFILMKKNDKKLRIGIFNEIFINAGKSIKKNIFDQNRISTSAKYDFSKIFGIELFYLYNLTFGSNGFDKLKRQVIGITLYNNFELKKKDN